MKGRSSGNMNKLELSNKQLEFLKYAILWYESNDKEEEKLCQEIETKIYELQEQNALRIIGAMKAQAKRPTAEW